LLVSAQKLRAQTGFLVVQLTILNGRKAGTEWIARRFPVRIGRSSACDLCLEEDGVWDQHLDLRLDPAQGFMLSVQPNAVATVNGQSIQETLLRNGDLIGMGALQMRFALSPTQPRGLRVREALTWFALAALSLGQVALIYWLVQ
jgi:pSer/pThr/pTyr-binding forkhead associated (FHA) protein